MTDGVKPKRKRKTDGCCLISCFMNRKSEEDNDKEIKYSHIDVDRDCLCGRSIFIYFWNDDRRIPNGEDMAK